MANTIVRIKKSGVTGNVPGSLALGELAINYTDGLLYFANSTGITSFSANASVIANAAFAKANAAYNQANTGGSGSSLANTGSLITVNGASQLLISNTTTSNSNTTGALVVNGSVGVASNVYIGNGGVMGFSNTTLGVSAVYTYYNPTYNSIDTVFG